MARYGPARLGGRGRLASGGGRRPSTLSRASAVDPVPSTLALAASGSAWMTPASAPPRGPRAPSASRARSEWARPRSPWALDRGDGRAAGGPARGLPRHLQPRGRAELVRSRRLPQPPQRARGPRPRLHGGRALRGDRRRLGALVEPDRGLPPAHRGRVGGRGAGRPTPAGRAPEELRCPAWTGPGAEGYPRSVASLAPNGLGLCDVGLGLCDVAGNVAEWCWDPYGPSPTSGTDPVPARSALYADGRLLKGAPGSTVPLSRGPARAWATRRGPAPGRRGCASRATGPDGPTAATTHRQLSSPSQDPRSARQVSSSP